MVPICKFSNTSLLSYILRPYNWFTWLLLHWAMLLVPSVHSKPLPKCRSIIGRKAWFPWFSSDFFSSFFFSYFIFQPSYPCPIRDSLVSFFTVLQCLVRGCATTGSKEERRHFLLMKLVVGQPWLCGLMPFNLLLMWYTWIHLSIVAMLLVAWDCFFAQERSTILLSRL